MTNEILKPVFAMSQPVHVICREGKLEDLLGQLATHRLDIVLADEPASSGKLSPHLQPPARGMPTLVLVRPANWRGHPRASLKSLHGAPGLLPSDNTALRRAVEAWFQRMDVQPRVVAEFDDLSLMKVVAAEGSGFIVLPSVVADEAMRHYGFRIIGVAEACRVQFHAITAERRLVHPAVVVLTEHARQHLV
ncbi:MAG: hypothetical protein HS113_04175 [Verrucomicrobiales bacterium]|nr:hypothetical protein [Verrucomicrobiales bacterium]